MPLTYKHNILHSIKINLTVIKIKVQLLRIHRLVLNTLQGTPGYFFFLNYVQPNNNTYINTIYIAAVVSLLYIKWFLNQ